MPAGVKIALGNQRSCAQWQASFRMVGNSESAGINRHVVGDARALQERK
jgi:hypothetical protein